jgi:hypothetical protein
MSEVVMDVAAILSFLQGESPELLPYFESGVEVSDVTMRQLEWHLIHQGAKRSHVKQDLARLGLNVMDFSERLNQYTIDVLARVKGLTFESAVAASVAQHYRGKLVTGSSAWFEFRLNSSPFSVQLVGSARIAPPKTEAVIPVVAVTQQNEVADETPA